ncbi:MAG TPA: hypothetical protein VGR82_02050 [Methylomirabilota bacterium]|jgi:hypothetical protein|nr:hypothetical protein [Methylomirabilota bacterium]
MERMMDGGGYGGLDPMSPGTETGMPGMPSEARPARKPVARKKAAGGAKRGRKKAAKARGGRAKARGKGKARSKTRARAKKKGSKKARRR